MTSYLGAGKISIKLVGTEEPLKLNMETEWGNGFTVEDGFVIISEEKPVGTTVTWHHFPVNRVEWVKMSRSIEGMRERIGRSRP